MALPTPSCLCVCVFVSDVGRERLDLDPKGLTTDQRWSKTDETFLCLTFRNVSLQFFSLCFCLLILLCVFCFYVATILPESDDTHAKSLVYYGSHIARGYTPFSAVATKHSRALFLLRFFRLILLLLLSYLLTVSMPWF